MIATLHDQLASVPRNRVVRLAKLSADAVAAEAARSGDLPAAVVMAAPRTGSMASFVGSALDVLDEVARHLLPGWLPEADELDSPQGATRAAVRATAVERARVLGCSSSFMADLAERALTGRRPIARLRPEARITGLARIVTTGFQRDWLALAVPVGPAPTDIVVAASEWLADRGRLGVWLTGTGPVRAPSADVVHGRPHPRSTVEAMLETALAGQKWAAGRIWNGVYLPASVRSPIRPDLWWPAERVIVELDGLEHCRPGQYDADRVRDVRLQLDGYAVLRFTNARVKHDVQAVATQIECLIQARRKDG